MSSLLTAAELPPLLRYGDVAVTRHTPSLPGDGDAAWVRIRATLYLAHGVGGVA